jgi:hypothetical protein
MDFPWFSVAFQPSQRPLSISQVPQLRHLASAVSALGAAGAPLDQLQGTFDEVLLRLEATGYCGCNAMGNYGRGRDGRWQLQLINIYIIYIYYNLTT